jgi:hypothetical protein
MARSILTYLFSGFSALFFLLAGTGFNIIHYCCNNCEAHGIEYASKEGCNHNNHQTKEDGCCKTLDNDESLYDFGTLNTDSEDCCKDGCTIERYQLELFAPATTINLANQYAQVDYQVFFDIHQALISCNSPILKEKPDPPGYIANFNQGRSILCRKSVLLI